MAKPVSIVHSDWRHYAENASFSSDEFYTSVERIVAAKEYPDVKTKRVKFWQGQFQAKREYLRVSRDELVFDICAAPYGKDFFLSHNLLFTT